MKLALSHALALAAALFLGAPAPAAASPETDAFSVACNANPSFFSFAAQGLEGNPEALGSLCGCLVTAIESYPAADVVMLTKDVDASATDADRTAFGDYTGLEMRALDTLTACVAEVGLVPQERQLPQEPADMAVFDASCGASPVVLQVLAAPTPEQGETQRTTLCACLSENLAPRVTTPEAAVLAADLDGTATQESREANEGYGALTELAGGVFDQCFNELAAAAANP